jgi:SAM-dependent methyltransferase
MGDQMMSFEDRVARHYGSGGQGDIATIILEALAASGKDTSHLTLEDLAPVDEFHIRGRAATAELARGLGLAAGMAVLDVGCGVGGPSRYIAATYGCRVTGVDLTEAYYQAAALLAERVGLGERVDYRQGSALAMPFAEAAFDAAYTQHAAMNIEDKAGLYREIGRVLKPGARFGHLRPAAGRGRRGAVSGALGARRRDQLSRPARSAVRAARGGGVRSPELARDRARGPGRNG